MDQHVIAPADIFTPSDQIILPPEIDASVENAYQF